MNKKTKIIATLGPASNDVATMEKMIRAGMNVARLNFSHGDHAEHKERIRNIRTAQKNTNTRIAILQDLSGPKIRTGDLKEEKITLIKGKTITLTSKKVLGDTSLLSVTYKHLAKDVQKGDRILLNDGKQELRVQSTTDTDVVCTVVVGGEMYPRRGVNLPDTTLSISAITPKDKKDIIFGAQQKVDLVALSFVQSAKDIHVLRKLLEREKSKALIIAKIETGAAIENLDEIMEATDGVMVARGDLAVEVGASQVPMLQKEIIGKANALGKPDIVATQMLESMIDAPVPTRAEISDISNAILDGADSIMLSGETAMGAHPVKVIEVMRDAALATEAKMNYGKRMERKYAYKDHIKTEDAIARYAAKVATDLKAQALVAFTETGTTPRMISRFRPEQPILVISPSDVTLNQMLVSFGTIPCLQTPLKRATDITKLARQAVLSQKLAQKGDSVVMVSGSIFGKPGETNTITVITV